MKGHFFRKHIFHILYSKTFIYQKIQLLFTNLDVVKMDVMIWIFIAVIFIILELITNTFFLVWFGVGALAGAVLNYLGFDIYVQFIVFVIVSAVLILSTRRFADRITPDSSKKTTAERLIQR